MEPSVLLASVLCLLFLFGGPVFGHQPSTLTMLYLNRTLKDGEDVHVIAGREETRIEAIVTCVARNSHPHQIIVFQFYAQNSILLDPKDVSWMHHKDMQGLTIGQRRVVLDVGGFLKLQCALTTHNSTVPVASASANFTFTYEDNQRPSILHHASRPRLWPIAADVLANNDSRPAVTSSRPYVNFPIIINNRQVNSARHRRASVAATMLAACCIFIFGML